PSEVLRWRTTMALRASRLPYLPYSWPDLPRLEVRRGFVPRLEHRWAQFGHSRGSRGYSDQPEMPVPLSAPGPTRTGDPQVRSLTLYPAELRARAAKSST